jgi:hypothetical protein
MKHSLALLAALLSAALLGCGSQPAPPAGAVFPADDEAPGWRVERQPRVFQAENLWEYIDGDAERYVQAGFENLSTAAYRWHGRIEVAADVYTMKSPTAATGILNAEAAQGSRPVVIGDAGKMYRASVVFRKGRHLVRLIAYEEDPDLQAALTALGQVLAKKL